MNFKNPLAGIFSKKDSSLAGGRVHSRVSEPLGPYQDSFDDYIFREVNPHLYEAIREAVGPIDGAINRLVTLDGIVLAEAATDRLQRELDDWMEGVLVNDMEQGFQAFYRSQGNEMYEQGHTIGEFILSNSGNDVERLRVADSKGTYFKRTNQSLETWYRAPGARRGRRDGSDQIERVLRNTYSSNNITDRLNSGGYNKINNAKLVYAGFNNEADGPYGVSLLRSTEFDVKVLLTMKNALMQTWTRFGDPIFNVQLKKKTRKDQTELDAQQSKLAENIAKVMDVKKSGNSADLVNVIGKDDDLDISILGGDGTVLEIEMPARHILEQIVSKTGLPSWMLGFHWSTAERLAQRQGDIAISESKTRFSLRKPGLTKALSAAMRARGTTWNKGDWEIKQDLPSLQDLVAKAQAEFLTAQTELMRSGSAGMSIENDTDNNKHTTIEIGGNNYTFKPTKKSSYNKAHQCKVESYVEDEAALMQLENTAVDALKSGWKNLERKLFTALGITSNKNNETIFIYNPIISHAEIQRLQNEFIDKVGSEDGDFIKSIFAAFERGINNAATELDIVAAIEASRGTTSQSLTQNGLQLVRSTTIRALGKDILLALEEGAYNGLNPKDVAKQLSERFELTNYNWDRLARSEIAQAQSEGKMAEYAANNVSLYDWKRAGGACPICIDKENNSPYAVGSGPLPMKDSHPNCRCTVVARLSV